MHNYILQSLLEEEGTVEELVCDVFGNYVIQKAIPVSKGENYVKFLTRIANSYNKLNTIPFGPSLYEKFLNLYPELKSFGKNNMSSRINNNTNKKLDQYNNPNFNQMNFMPNMMNQNQRFFPMQNNQFNNYPFMQSIPNMPNMPNMQNFQQGSQKNIHAPPMNWGGMMNSMNPIGMMNPQFNNNFMDSYNMMNQYDQNYGKSQKEINKKVKKGDRRK